MGMRGWPPDTGPIEDDVLRQHMTKLGNAFDTLPDTLTGHGSKLVRVRTDETGWEYVAAPTGFEAVVRAITGDVTLDASLADGALTGEGVHQHAVCLVRHATNPASAIAITIPANAEVGSVWTLVQAMDQTGTVTISPASGVTLHGQTGSVTLDGPGAVVTLLTVANAGGSAAEVILAGAVSLGQRLTGVTSLGEVKGAYPTIGAAITGNVTLDASDIGTERRITASSTVTITVPSGFRGSVVLWNASSVNHTVALTGVGNRTLGAGNLGVVRGNGIDLALFVASPASS